MNITTTIKLENFLSHNHILKYGHTSKFKPQLVLNDIEFIFEMCRRCSYVSQNPEYKLKSENTCIMLDNDTVVNAYAQTFKGIEGNGKKKGTHGITIMTGLINASMLMSVAIAQFRIDSNIDKLTTTCNWIGVEAVKNNGCFTSKMLWEGIEIFNYVTNGIVGIEANSYLTGALLSVIGHELGHICLAHTIRGDRSNGISRNDERQADLFAHSVVTTTPFSSYTVLGTLFTEVIFTWMSKGHTGPATTHPHSRERVYNTMASHDEILTELGITMDNIDSFLPPKNSSPIESIDEDDYGDDEDDEDFSIDFH